MLYKIANFYAAFFANKLFYKWNKLLFHCALRGLGIHNSQTRKRSGEENFLRNLLNQKGNQKNTNQNLVIFDVGANVGNYSLYIKKINPNTDIYAFEPHPKTFQKLEKTASQNNFNAFNVGCGESEGNLTIYDYAQNDGSSHASLYKGVMEDIYQKESIATEVKIIPLDPFIEKLIVENKISQIDLLKIDTEGHELAVLQGAKSALEKGIIKAIHFEFNSMNIISRTFFKDFMDLLPNYQFYRMLPDSLHKIEKYDPIYDEIFAFQNIVAFRK